MMKNVILRAKTAVLFVLSVSVFSNIAVSSAAEKGKTVAKQAKQAKQSVDDPLTIFNRRILPIMNSAKASSCTECHLSGVELRNYIHTDQATTFAALRKDGLIDVKNPEKSKILTFISRKPKKTNPLTEKVREKELAAFRAWLIAAVKEPQLLKATAGEKTLGTKLPVEVIRHARKNRVLASFVDNVWSQMGRCINCHSPNRNQRLIKKHGDAVSWIVPNNPWGTMQKLIDAGNIDPDAPKQSPVLTKPAGLEKHGGGPKFLVGGQSYRKFVVFLNDYAATVNGKYKAKKDLPKPQQELVLLGKQHLRILGMPEKWNKLPLRVDIYRWDKANRRWSETRWATAFGPVNGKRRMWQNLIALTAKTGSARETLIRKQAVIPPGTYLAKLYLDADKKTAKNPNYELGKREFIGQVEFHGRWVLGYRKPKILHAPNFRKD